MQGRHRWAVCPTRIWWESIGDDGKRPFRDWEWGRKSKREMGRKLCS